MNNIEGIEGDGVVVKWIWNEMPQETLNERWDKIILLSRENLREQGIYMQRARERNEWIDEYGVSTQWIKRNEKGILHWQNLFKVERDELNRTNGIRITYESIYIRGEGRELLKRELGVVEWKHLDIISPDKRYRKETKPI